MPAQVLAAPLLREDAEERGGEAEDKTEEPEDVDPACGRVSSKIEGREGWDGEGGVDKAGREREALELD